MNSALIALKLLLDGLGVPPTVGTLQQRKAVQKAVYLGQRIGVDLGYRFGWYLMGPYSPDLARDYYALDAEIQDGSKEHEKHKLAASARAVLGRLTPVLAPPPGIERPEWLELLASLDYLIFVSGLSFEKARAVVESEKPQLAPRLDQAKDALQRVSLLTP